MDFIIPLNFPPCRLQLSRKDGKVKVCCLSRRKFVHLTPEEWVRQHIIAYLSDVLGFPLSRISVEQKFEYNGRTKRWDIVVFSADAQPQILVECKAPDVPLTAAVFQQLASYQAIVNAEVMLMSNGLENKIWRFSKVNMRWHEIGQIPDYDSLSE